MKDNDYRLPALAAFAAAVMIPLLWLADFSYAIVLGEDTFMDLLRRGVGVSDLLLLVAGALTVFAYHGFRQALRERLAYRSLDLLLLGLMIMTGLFHGMAFLQALIAPLFSGEGVAFLALALWVPFMVIFGALDLLIAIILLRDRKQLPDTLTVLAVLTLVLGLLEITVIFSLAAIVLLPLTLVVLGLYLVREPEYLEVI